VRLRLRDGEVDGAVVRRAAGTAALTPREQAVLEWLAARRDRAVTRDELLIEVFGMSPDARSRAVDVIARRLREKLEVDPERPEHVLTVFGTGYRFVESPAPALPPDPGFVGRKDEVERLATALSGPVTAVVVGPPGVGKTRLVARLVAGEPDAWWVDLTGARTEGWVWAALARRGCPEQPEPRPERVVGALAAAARPLVVFDNAEGAADAVAAVSSALRARLPESRVIVTTRRRLPGDVVVTLGPLRPDEGAALFRRLAGAARPAVHDDPAVVDLVAALEHLPLAIALAAGRAGALSPRAMTERVCERFRLLRGREGGLEAALRSSWELASPREREVLTACASFRGGFTPAAARAVAGGDDVDEVLERAVQGSLLERRGERFGGYAFVREFVEERLAEDPTRRDRVFAAHAAWFRSLAAGRGAGRGAARDLAPELDNLVAAARRATAAADRGAAVELTVVAASLLGRLGPVAVGLELVEAALALPDARPRDLVELLVLRCRFLTEDRAAAEACAEDAVARARALGEPRWTALALRALAIALRERAALSPALEAALEAEALARREHPAVLVDLLETVGSLLLLLGRTDEAWARWRELEALSRRLDDPVTRMNALGNLGRLERRAGATAAAAARFREVIALAAAEGAVRTEAVGRSSLGSLLLDEGELEGARDEYVAALALARRLGDGGLVATVGSNLALVARDAGDLVAAEARTRRSLEWYQQAGEERQVALAHGNLGEIALAAGRFEEAAQWLRLALEVLGAAGSPEVAAAAEYRSSLGVALLRAGGVDDAARELAAAVAEGRRARSPRALALALARRGLWERVTGRRDAAAASLAEARSLAPTTRATSDVGRAVAELAAALSRG
jgi:tetratricopeptide (TPR) repeat protein